MFIHICRIHICIFNIYKENRLIPETFRYLPTPMTFSILMQDASISLANSRTAWLGSSYVKGSTYVLTPKK